MTVGPIGVSPRGRLFIEWRTLPDNDALIELVVTKDALPLAVHPQDQSQVCKDGRGIAILVPHQFLRPMGLAAHRQRPVEES